MSLNHEKYLFRERRYFVNPRFRQTGRARSLIPFPDQSESRREAADSAVARQGEATTYRIDLELESQGWHPNISYAEDGSIVEIVLLDAKKEGLLPLEYRKAA